MELIYLYVEKFGDIVKKQEINFSPDFNVKIKDKKLIIENKVSYINKLYPNNIKNINMLLGKNGSGKTTILDIFGMNLEDRCRNSIKRKGMSRNQVVDFYFILYHIEGDYYGIEVMDDIEPKDKITKLFRNKITNFNFPDKADIFYKIPMGFVFKKDNDKFQVCRHFFDKWQKGDKLSDLIRVNYISKNYSERIDIKHNYIGKDEDNYEKDPYFCKRRYYLNPSKVMQYQFINHLNSNEHLDFIANSAVIEIKPNFDYALDFGTIETEERKQMRNWIDNLEKILYVDKADRIDLLKLGDENQQDEVIENNNNDKKYKEVFILDILSSNIIDAFINGICGLIDNNVIQNSKTKEIHIDLSNDEYIKFLNNLKFEKYIQCNSESVLGTLANKKNEYENLLKVINYYKEDRGINIYDKLFYISRYLYSRMESAIGLGEDSKFQIATEEFIKGLYSLKESYFSKDKISISCNLKQDETLIAALEIYDKYEYSEYNQVNKDFKIKFLHLSEGQRNFLNIFSQISDIVSKTKENQLSIILLDEPDQSLHPEWSRRFVDFLCEEMKCYENKKIQIILSTHSPFLASDLPKENIIFLKNEKGQCRVVLDNEFKQTFGANIHTLLTKSFIMDNTIGEHANREIKKVIKELSGEIDITKDRKHEIKYIISSIGEPVIKRKLEVMYNKRFEHLEINNKIEALSNKVNELEKIIKANGL